MKRKASSLILALALMLCMSVLFYKGSSLPAGAQSPAGGQLKVPKGGQSKAPTINRDADAEADVLAAVPGVPALANIATGKPIMNKMPNMTARAELGRAGWKMLHTMLAQYPEEPSKDAQSTLHNYLHLFSRIYPCGECAAHFQQLLKDHPPQLSSRKAAVMWGCDAHNKVNKRLGKPIFDCAHIDDMYDCGCGTPEDDLKVQLEEEKFEKLKAESKSKAKKAKSKAKLEPVVPKMAG